MNSSFVRAYFFGIVIAAFSLASVGAQTFEYKDGRKLEIEFVQEPPCPVKISVKSVDLKPGPDAQSIQLQIENMSEKPIRAYSMVSGGNRHPNMHTWIFGGEPFGAGKTLIRSIWPNSQEHYYFFFDYILFADGTTCGNDNHTRSVQIRDYLDARAAAVARLRELSYEYLNPDELISGLESKGLSDFLSLDNPGPPNPETIRSMPRRAYQNVIINLRRMDFRRKDFLAIAEKLEKESPR